MAARELSGPRVEVALIGRGAELEAIGHALELVAAGQPCSIAFVGEPGIGKTALLQAACDLAVRAGLPVLRGQATEFEAQLPFGVFGEALDRALRDGHGPAASLGNERLRELARAFPSLSGTGEGQSTGLQAERFRLHSAVRTTLEQLATEHPFVLALDDVHWADRSSSELLAYLLWHGIPAPVLMLYAYRPHETPDPFLYAAAAAAREGRAMTLELEPLAPREADELLGDELDEGVRSALYRESGGNPFYLMELARSGRKRGRFARPDDRKPAPVPGAVPPGVASAIAQEVATGSARARALLKAAAVVGEPFELELAARVAELDQREALEALDELGKRALIKTTDVPSRYAFRHPILRHAVYESAGTGFTLAAHRRAAEVLEGWGASPVVRALHIERSARVGDLDAVAVLTAAANATALRAPTIAAGWLASALRLLPSDAAAQRRLELLIPLATALGTTGQVEESRARLAEAVPLLDDDDVVLKARLVGTIARLDHMVGRHGGAREQLERAIREAGPEPSAGSTALKLELAMDHLLADEWDETVEVAQATRADAEALGDRLSHATALGVEAVGCGYLGQLDRAAALAGESAATIDELSDAELATRVDALVVLSHAELAGAEHAFDSARHADRGIAISRATGQDSWYMALTFQRCVANLLLGRLAEASEAADSALESSRLGHHQTEVWALTLRCWVDRLTGDLSRAIVRGEEAVTLAERTDTAQFNWLAYSCLAMALIEAGRPQRARSLILDHAAAPELKLAFRGWLPQWYETLSRAELETGDIEAATRSVERAHAAAEAFPSSGRLSMARSARAALELERGQPRAAVDFALEAMDGFLAAEWPIATARSRILAARGLRALGERERAIELLRRAHADLDTCGARAYRDEAARELRSLGERVSRHGGTGAALGVSPESLSPREREVAELVAKGMTNRQIADELFVSPKTVESHMTRILGKTGVPSRAALAAVVERWRREREGD